jgi:hypothetical protein
MAADWEADKALNIESFLVISVLSIVLIQTQDVTNLID